MLYCVKNDIYLAFGKSNADKWADLNNNGIQSEVDARYVWAIAQASNELDARLADSPYQFPLDDVATVPPIVVRMASFLAGVLLYESRGITDIGPMGAPTHHLSWHRKWVYDCIRDIYGRKLELPGAVLAAGSVEISVTPDFVSFDDPLDS